MKRIPSLGAIYFALFTFFLYLPIGILILFSFNDGATLSFPMKGFTLRWYGELLKNSELLAAVWNSLLVGVVSSAVATLLGALAALGVVRYDFRGKSLFMAVASMPMVIPSVVLGVAMLLLFRQVGIPQTLWTVGIGHTIINFPYALLIVAARLAGMDAKVEEAAMDLGANYLTTLWRVTLPISTPALIAAFLSSFTTSLDEFAVTFFLVGADSTLPIYLYSQLRYPSRLPIVVTLAAMMMILSILIVVVLERLRRSK